MRNKLTLSLILFFSFSVIYAQEIPEYLRKVLHNLEQVRTASHYTTLEVWQHGEDTPLNIYTRYAEEYDNPADTFGLGVQFVYLDPDDKSIFEFGYNGNIRAVAYPEDSYTMVDDFTFRKLPFAPMLPPFFSYTKNILRYMITTEDNIQTEWRDLGDEVHLKLTIHEDRQVEFFGKAHPIDNPYCEYPTSIYEVWINKSNDLPYKYRREMSHNITVESLSGFQINHLSPDEFNLYDYFNPDFEIRPYGQKMESKLLEDMVGKMAPDWNFENMVGQTSVSLADLKSKVVLIQFTGIGCGPCQISIPFLNRLKAQFADEELEVVAVEIWGRQPRSMQNYASRYGINYRFLSGNDEMVKPYQTGGSVPAFYVLDNQRIIRKISKGYAEGKTDREILEVITELL